MPIYEYECEACGGSYEQMRRMAEADHELECPSCKSQQVNRRLSSFATTTGTSTSGRAERAPSGGPCGMGACGAGGCGFGKN